MYTLDIDDVPYNPQQGHVNKMQKPPKRRGPYLELRIVNSLLTENAQLTPHTEVYPSPTPFTS